MKEKLFKAILILLTLGLIFQGCSEDDGGQYTNSNEFSYDGSSYSLSKGAIIKYVSNKKGGPFQLDLCLASSNVNFDSLTGTGNFIYFEMFSTLNTALTSGEYFPAETSETFTFDSAAIFINYNLTTEEGTSVGITNGSVTISNNGSSYTVTINCEDANGKKVSGSYTGALQFYTKEIEEIENAFTYLGTEYPLSQGLVVYHGDTTDNGAYKLDFYLASPEINFESSTGTGECVYFEILSNSSTTISSGQYNFNETEETFSFDSARVFIDYNVATREGTEIDIVNGSITVDNTDNSYIIDFECKDSNGKKIIGNYTGTLQYADDIEQTPNSFSYLGTEYELSQVASLYEGEFTPGVYTHVFVLSSSGLNFEEMTGTDNAVVFNVHSSSKTDLPVGEYTFEDPSTSIFHFFVGSVILDWNIENDRGNFFPFSEGSFSVSKTPENIYTIIVNCKDEQGNTAVANYTGEIKFYDKSGKKAKSLYK